ncbi:MAG: hypothetical protein RL226_553, partial [Bacteroidota bacterium]
IGGVGAWLLFSNHHLIQIVFRPVVQLTSLLAIPVLLYFTPRVVQDGIHLLHSVFFLIVILNVAANKQSVLKLENRFFHELGKISYGMYMYHLMVVVAVLHLAAQFFPSMINTWGGNAVIYLTCVVVTSAISYLSYHYFEYYFIRLKQRFTKVVSGDDAKKA